MKAYSTLPGVILLLVFLGIVTTGMTFVSISELKTNYYTTASATIIHDDESCIDEGIRRLRDDINYNGGTIPLLNGLLCEINITGNSDQKEIIATINNEIFPQSIAVSILITTDGTAHNFRISSWERKSD